MEVFDKIEKILREEIKNKKRFTVKNKIIKHNVVDEAVIQRHSNEYKEWRKAIFRRDRNTCQKCGRRGCRINAHHILGFKKYKRLRFNIDNGITLCSKCHRKFHEQYGKNNFPDIRKVWKLNERNK